MVVGVIRDVGSVVILRLLLLLLRVTNIADMVVNVVRCVVII